MKKKIIIILALALLLSSAFMTACSKDKDSRIVVAKIDGEKIFKSEYNIYWQNVMEQYSITAEVLQDEQYKEDLDRLRSEVLTSIVNQKAMKVELEKLGYYELTETEHNNAKSQRDAIIDNALAAKEQEMLAELGVGYSEKEFVKVIQKYTQIVYDEFGITKEEFLEYYIDEIAIEKAKAKLINITVTDKEIIELYDERVEKDKELFDSDIELYEYYTTQAGYSPYYVPDGLRMVRHVLIAFDDETAAKIRELRSAENNADADKLVNTSLKVIQAEAEAILNMLRNGEITFDVAIEEYNDDPGMASNPQGYQMSKDSKLYVQAFTDGGMSLIKIGDISELVGTDFGYHIIEYTSDVPSGPVDIDFVRNVLYDEILNKSSQEAWNTQLQIWTAQHEVEYFLEKLVDEVDEVNETQ